MSNKTIIISFLRGNNDVRKWRTLQSQSIAYNDYPLSASITDRTMKTSALSAEKHGTIVSSNLKLGYMNTYYAVWVEKVKIWQKTYYKE